jgi:hypothetical protein
MVLIDECQLAGLMLVFVGERSVVVTAAYERDAS